MLKINLLEEKRGQKKEVKIITPKRKFLSKVLLVTLATLLVMVGVTYYLSRSEAALKKQSEDNKALIAQLQQKIQDVKKFESLNASSQQKAVLIETLRKNQSVPVRILDEISAVLPEGVWLSSMLYKDDSVSIEGYAFTNLDIVSYVENLKRSGLITEVSLDESKYDEIDKIQVYKFRLNFKVKS